MTVDLFPRFSDAEYTRRYHAIRGAMEKESLDAILISGARGSSEVAYLSNYHAQSPCWLLYPREGQGTVFIHFFNHQPCAKARAVDPAGKYGPRDPTQSDHQGLQSRLQLGAAVIVKPSGGEPLHNYPFKFSVCG